MSNLINNVDICITGVQHQVNAAYSDPPVVVRSKGTYCEKDDVFFLKYRETYDTEEDVSECLLKVYDNRIELVKMGAVNTHMSFVLGQTTKALYEFPFGSINMGVVTKSVYVSKERKKIIAHASYELYMEENKTADCNITIEVTQ